MASKAVVSADARKKIRELLKRIMKEKGQLFLAMLAQSSPELPDRWNFIVSAPWMDSAGPRFAVSYLSSRMKSYLDKNALSAIDRISVLQTTDPVVDRILRLTNEFLGVRPSLREEGEFHIWNWVVGDLSIPEGFIFVADPDANMKPPRSLSSNHRTAAP